MIYKPGIHSMSVPGLVCIYSTRVFMENVTFHKLSNKSRNSPGKSAIQYTTKPSAHIKFLVLGVLLRAIIFVKVPQNNHRILVHIGELCMNINKVLAHTLKVC